MTANAELLERLDSLLQETRESTGFDHFQITTTDVSQLQSLCDDLDDLAGRAGRFNRWESDWNLGALTGWSRSAAERFRRQIRFRTGVIAEISEALRQGNIPRISARTAPDHLHVEVATEDLSHVDELYQALRDRYLEQFVVFFEQAKERQDRMMERVRLKKSLFSYDEQLRMLREEFEDHLPFDREPLLKWVKDQIERFVDDQTGLFESVQELLDRANHDMADESWADAIRGLRKILAMKPGHFEASAALTKATRFSQLYATLEQTLKTVSSLTERREWDAARRELDKAVEFAEEHGLGERARRGIAEAKEAVRRAKEKHDREARAGILRSKAEALKEELDSLCDARRFAEAARRLEESASALSKSDGDDYRAKIAQGQKWQALIHQAESAARSGEYAKAVQHYEGAEALLPFADTRQKIDRLNVLVKLQKSIDEARKLKTAKKWKQAAALYGKICAATDDPGLHIEANEVKEELTCEDLVGAAESAYEAGDYDESISRYEQACRIRRRQEYLVRIDEIKKAAASGTQDRAFKQALAEARECLKRRDGKSALKALARAETIRRTNEVATLTKQAQAFLRWDELVTRGNDMFYSRDWDQLGALFKEARQIHDTPELASVVEFIETELSIRETCTRIESAATSHDWPSVAESVRALPRFAFAQRPVREVVERGLRGYGVAVTKARQRKTLTVVASAVAGALVVSVLIALL